MAPCVLAAIRSLYPWLRHIFADGGYAGEKLRTALKRIGEWTIEIIKRSDTAQGFEVLPRRWVVERTSHGSVAVVDWQRISKQPSPALLPGRSSPTSELSRGDSQELEIK